MRTATFAGTLEDSGFSSTLMGIPVQAPHSVALRSGRDVERSWLGRLFGAFGKPSSSSRHNASCVNAATGLYSERGLLELGARMLAECHRARRPLALVVLNFKELDDLRRDSRAPVARKAALVIARRCLALAGVGGLAARTGASEFALLLPGHTAVEALAALRADLGKYPSISCDTRRGPVELMAGVRAGAVSGSGSVAPTLAMVRAMPAVTVLASSPSVQAVRKPFDLPDRECADVQFPSTMPAPLPA